MPPNNLNDETQGVSVSSSTAPVQSTAATSATAASAASVNYANKLESKKATNFMPYILLGVLTLLFGAHVYHSQTQMSALNQEVAKRIQSAEISNNEVKFLTKSLQESAKEVQAKVTLLESKQTEAQGQQLALEQLYQDLSRNRDEWALTEIEQILTTASQQLQLAGNVQGALIALQNADNRLAKSEKAQFIAIRHAIAKDMDKLKVLPVVDLTGMVLRLDSVIAQVENIPLWSDEKAAVAATAPKAPLRLLPAMKVKQTKNDVKSEAINVAKTGTTNEATADVVENTYLTQLQDRWQSFYNEMWLEVKQLIRIRNVENPDVLLLEPSQAYFVKENLKLRLLNARLALLSRNESAFRNDMISAQDIIAKYFDGRSKQAQTAQSLLKQVQSSNLSIEMPALTESLNSVRNFKVKP